MARGIPILTTLATEISQILFYKGLVLTVPMQNPDLLANEILLAAEHPSRMKNMAEKARKIFENTYTYQLTVGDLLEWCKNPCHSKDFDQPAVRLDYRFQDEMIPPKPKTFLRKVRDKIFS